MDKIYKKYQQELRGLLRVLQGYTIAEDKEESQKTKKDIHKLFIKALREKYVEDKGKSNPSVL